jgi:hypothetical protein
MATAASRRAALASLARALAGASAAPASAAAAAARGLAAAARGLAAAAAASAGGVSAPSPRSLWDLVQRARLEPHSPAQIRDIWAKYHEDSPGRFAAVLTAAEYGRFRERAAAAPLLALPAFGAGFTDKYEAFMLQVSGVVGWVGRDVRLRAEPKIQGAFPQLNLNCRLCPPPRRRPRAQAQLPVLLATSLEDFKRRGAAAPPHLVVTHYPELANSKGLVLVRGDLVHVGGSLAGAAAPSLLRRAYDYYLDDVKYKRYAEAFNERPAEFDWAALLAATRAELGDAH